MTEKKDSYAAAGVNYEVIDPGKRLAQAKALETASTLAPRGHSEITESRGSRLTSSTWAMATCRP